ncbi:MAG: NADH-quinone oxidoreductase subunit D [Vampirovibrionales bacterium]|nr:NADH-quinone oxidoreductase subunit D [Vampirovibrionales bacterium]
MSTSTQTPAFPEIPGVLTEQGLSTNDLVVNIGPQHPSTHGVLRLITTLNGEVVKDMEPVIGYLHRSKEKMGETRSYFQYQPTIDRVEYLSSFYDHYAYVTAIEKISNLIVPRRVEYIRMITMELNRITSHLLWFGTFLMDLGATSPLFYAFREREAIIKLFEDVTGARMMYNYYRFGGVNADLPVGWINQCLKVVNDLPKAFDEYEAIVTQNPIVLDRTIGVGKLTKEDCLKYGVTGPTLRSTGVSLDLRKTNPYSVYSEVDFDVPLGTHGDVYDRYMIRVQEMRESVKIIQQALKQIPGGDTANVAQKEKEIAEATRLAKEQGLDPTNIPKMDPDWLIQGQKVNLMVFKPAAGEAMSLLESPRGFLGCYLISDGSPKALRVKWRGASFSNLSILPHLMIGNMYPDLMPIFGSLDVILPEVDR